MQIVALSTLVGPQVIAAIGTLLRQLGTLGRGLIGILAMIVLEVARVDVGHQRRLHILAQDNIPVDISEPAVLHDLHDVLVAQILVFLQHPSEEIFDILAQIWLIEGKIGMHDFVKHAHVVLIVEGRETSQHLIE